MVYVVAYDIEADRLRSRVAKMLEGFGSRVQKSVFECHLKPEQLSRMTEVLQQHELADYDSIRVYTLCASCKPRVNVMGYDSPTGTPAFQVI